MNTINPIKKIFLIDDERAVRDSISQWLSLADFEVESYSNGAEAVRSLSADFQGVVVTDLKMQNFDGMEVIKQTMKVDIDIPVILITGHGDINSAVRAMQLGAYDFIEKPFEPDRLLSVVKRATEKRHLIVQNRMLQKRVNSAPIMEQRLIGESAPMKQLRKNIAEFAQIDINVLLIGETGTGKEVIAHCLHDFGNRAGKPFHAIDCGALPSDRLEVDLFGTSGDEGKKGQLALADHGTLFLDEILNIPVSQQVKLLRFLQSREIRPVGESANSAIDIRVISAANDTIHNAIKEDEFRSDLYFRLNTIELKIPPLRERGNDVVELFDHYANKAAQTYQRELPTIKNADITALKSHIWSGNVRELKNAAERFVLYQNQSVTDILNNDNRTELREKLQDQVLPFEKSMIEFALKQCSGNINETCQKLGIPRRTLNDKLVKYEIDRLQYCDSE